MMKNALEEVVHTSHDQLLRSHAEFCPCEKCKDDVVTLALNHLKPRYVVGDPLGAAITRVLLEQDQAKTEITIAVFDAMRRVAANPRHEPGRASRPVTPP
jgi:competence protein ComFB